MGTIEIRVVADADFFTSADVQNIRGCGCGFWKAQADAQDASFKSSKLHIVDSTIGALIPERLFTE